MTARRRSGGRPGGRDGFLLIEALTTLALGALIIAGLSGVIILMLRFSDRTATDLSRREVLGRAVDIVEREIRGMARARLAAGENAPFIFAGRPDRLLFTIDRPDGSGLVVPVVIAYRTGTRDGVVRLARAEAAVPPGLTSVGMLQFGQPDILYAGDRGIRFAYFSPQPDGTGEVLTDDWKQADKLPTAIRVAVTASDGSVLESARVPLMVDAEPGCASPGKGFCSLPGAAKKQEPGADGATDPAQPGQRDASGRVRLPRNGGQ